LVNQVMDSNQTISAQAQPRLRFRWLSDRLLTGAFLTPTMLLLLFITIFPLIWSLYLSFTSYNVNSDPSWTQAQWVGLQNYSYLLNSKKVWGRFVESATFVIPTVTLEFLLGFGIALLFNRKFKGRGFITTVILIPMMLAPLVVGMFWRFMFQADIGVVNYFVRDVFGLKPVFWLTERTSSMISLIVVDTWQWTPFMFLISLAGLSAVPRYLYEAAEVDRASAWFKFWHITLPLVWPLLLIAILFRLMDAYKLFELAWVLTGGGPGTRVLPIHLYKIAFGDFRTGRASALGYIMLIVIIALANMLIRAINQSRAEE
jgi:multiple sugar transport system permease protein